MLGLPLGEAGSRRVTDGRLTRVFIRDFARKPGYNFKGLLM